MGTEITFEQTDETTDERVARLEARVAELEKIVGADNVDPLAQQTALFMATNRAKAKVGVKPPRRS